MIPRTIIMHQNSDLLRLPVFCQLYIRRGLDDKLYIPLRKLVEACGYKPNRNKGRINERVIGVLNQFHSDKYISFHPQLHTQRSDMLEISVNQEIFDIQPSFGIVSLAELTKILNVQSDQIEKSRRLKPEYLIYILSYIRLNKSRRSSHQQSVPEEKPEIFFQHLKNMSKELGISPKTLQRGVDILEKLEIIITSPMPRHQDTCGNWHTDVTIFVDKYEGWEQELQWGIDFLRNGRKLRYIQGTGQ